MGGCTAPVRGHATASGAASCPIHGERSSHEQVTPLPVVSPLVESSVRVEILPDGGQREEWWVEGRLHRTDGPAWVERNDAGVVVYEEWFVEGHRHRTDGPAVMERNAAGVVTREEWFVEGHYHRADGPAAVKRNDVGMVVYEGWWVEGRCHRTDGPAYVERNAAGVATREVWFVEGRRHRIDGPAWVEYNTAGVVVREGWWVAGKDVTPAEVFGLFLADKGEKGLSPEALEFLAKGRHYEQWDEITGDEIALARLMHPTTEVT